MTAIYSLTLRLSAATSLPNTPSTHTNTIEQIETILTHIVEYTERVKNNPQDNPLAQTLIDWVQRAQTCGLTVEPETGELYENTNYSLTLRQDGRD